GRVGGKVRIAGPGGEDDDASFFEMARGATANVGLGDLADLDRREDARAHRQRLEGTLQRQAVDDGREHPHVVAGRAVDAEGLPREAAKEIAPADDVRELAAEVVYL